MVFFPHAPLLMFGLFGYVALHHFSNTNGLFDLLNAAVANGVYSQTFIPVKGLNDVCNFFLAFFWPCVDGTHPGLSLACFVFAGQWIAGCTLIVMEGYRAGNRGRAISFIVIFGFCYKALGLGLCAPFYLLAHVMTSPTASRPTAENVLIPKPVLLSIIPTLTVGLVLPTALMSLPTPSRLTYATKANLVLLWQFTPVWTSLVCILSSYVFSQVQTTLKATNVLRAVYTFAIALSSVAHIAALTLSITPTFAPSLFNAAHAKDLVAAHLAFPPWPIQSEVKASSMAEGALWFIQYDYILTSWAFLFWSISLKSASLAKGAEPSALGTAIQCLSAVGRAVILGPLASAASLVWERDEEALRARENVGDTSAVKKNK